MKERLHLNSKINPFSVQEKDAIIKAYANYGNELNLDWLAACIGRPKTSICRFARTLDLTDQRRESEAAMRKKLDGASVYRTSSEYINNVKPVQAKLLTFYAKNHHPKGMKGKHHNAKTRESMSATHRDLAEKMTPEEKRRIAKKAVATKVANGGITTTSNAYSRCKGGFREDIEHYFRSSWEANIARLLNAFGIEWEYEPKRFFYPDLGDSVLSYQPDFYLPQFNFWIEVKGWMDEKSKIRINRFKEFFPDEYTNFLLIDSKVYRNLEREYKKEITNWELYGNYKKREKFSEIKGDFK